MLKKSNMNGRGHKWKYVGTNVTWSAWYIWGQKASYYEIECDTFMFTFAPTLRLTWGGFKSKDTGRFLLLQKIFQISKGQ